MESIEERVRKLRPRLAALSKHPHLREACSLVLDQVVAAAFGVTDVNKIKQTRAWSTVSARHTLSADGAAVVGDVVALVVPACDHPNAVDDGGCREGCCDYYRCPDCGKRWKDEHDG